jgi:large subunit ribosomal protein L20
MSRVTSGKVTHRRHKKVLEQAKGYYGRRSRAFKTAKQAVDKANQYATRDRKVLADLAVHEPEAFGAIVEQAKGALAAA